MKTEDAKKLLFFVGTPIVITVIVKIVRFIEDFFKLDFIISILVLFSILGIACVLWITFLYSIGISPRFRWFINFKGGH